MQSLAVAISHRTWETTTEAESSSYPAGVVGLHQHMGQQLKQLYTQLYKVKHPYTPATKTAKGR